MMCRKDNTSNLCQVNADMPSPTLLPWDPRFWNKTHGLTLCFKNPTINSKMEKKNYLFSTSSSGILSKKEVIFIYFPLVELLYFPLYFVRNTAVLLRDDKNMFIIGFFYLHNISVREIAVSAFTFQIEETWRRQQRANFIRASLIKHVWNLTLFEVFQVTLQLFVFLAVRNCLVIMKDWRMLQIIAKWVS